MKLSAFPVLSLGIGAFAADCLQQRQGSEPNGAQIARALTSNSQLENVCATKWRAADNYQLNITANHWEMLYYVEMKDNTKPLRYCEDAFNNILDQCVTNGNYWGGIWSLDGETYKISNHAYPANGLAPMDDGGPKDPGTTTGPVTVGALTTTESGTFTTTTETIAGLTTHSVTTTSADDHPTILPIWFVSTGVGILLIPGPGVKPGGIVPPPPGFPPLTIGPDGEAHTQDDDDGKSTTSSTSSCTACAGCAGFDILSADVTAILENDGDPNLPTIDPSIWAAMETKYPLPTAPASPTLPAPSTPTQSAGPIDRPACLDANDDVKKDLPQWTTKGNAIRLGDGSYHSVRDILYMLRQVVCDGSCQAPNAIDSKYVAAYRNGGLCEVSVALSAQIEVFVSRDTWPDNNNDFNTIWQECWDSAQYIIDKCVNNQAKSGWWNGDHIYQFYAAGLRSLNDPSAHHTQNGISLSNYLEPSTDGLSCDRDCCGYVPNPQWCRQNCGRPCSRGNRQPPDNSQSAPTIFSRNTETVATVGGCNLRYTLPDYPSAGVAENIAAVQKFYDRDDTSIGTNNCDNPRLTGPVAKVPAEHVYEKHIIKRFLYYLVGGQQAFEDSTDPDAKEPIATCGDVEAVFGGLNPQGTHFKTETPAQQLAQAVSCQGRLCPDSSRVNEFFLLRKEINGIKNRIFTGYYTGIGADPNDNKLPSCNPENKNARQMQQMMIDAAMVFQYMNKREVFEAFNAVHLRIREILEKLDADALGSNLPPRNLPPFVSEGTASTWLAAYDEFMNRFLVDTERKMELWLHDCKQEYDKKIDESSATDAEKSVEKQKISHYATGSGVYADEALKLSAMWDQIKGNS